MCKNVQKMTRISTTFTAHLEGIFAPLFYTRRCICALIFVFVWVHITYVTYVCHIMYGTYYFANTMYKIYRNCVYSGSKVISTLLSFMCTKMVLLHDVVQQLDMMLNWCYSVTMAKCYHRNCAHIVWTAVYSVKFTSCGVILVSRIRHRVCTYCSCPWLQIYRRYAWGSDDI